MKKERSGRTRHLLYTSVCLLDRALQDMDRSTFPLRCGLGWAQGNHHHHHHFICPIIQQYVHLHEYDFRRAGQQGPIGTLTDAVLGRARVPTGERRIFGVVPH